MKSIESNYTSHAAYTCALEEYCETLGNKVAAQAAVIELLREALHITANSCQYLGAEKWDIVAKALSTKTDSAQILQKWLDSVMGEPVGFMTADRQFRFETPRKDIKAVYFKPEALK